MPQCALPLLTSPVLTVRLDSGVAWDNVEHVRNEVVLCTIVVSLALEGAVASWSMTRSGRARLTRAVHSTVT